jgi:hypothetical protein
MGLMVMGWSVRNPPYAPQTRVFQQSAIISPRFRPLDAEGGGGDVRQIKPKGRNPAVPAEKEHERPSC